MLRALNILFDLLPFRSAYGGYSGRPIHFSSRSRRRLNRARISSHIG